MQANCKYVILLTKQFAFKAARGAERHLASSAKVVFSVRWGVIYGQRSALCPEYRWRRLLPIVFNSSWGPSFYHCVICCLPACAGLSLGRVIDCGVFGAAAGWVLAVGASPKQLRHARHSLATVLWSPCPPAAASPLGRCPGGEMICPSLPTLYRQEPQ